MQSPLTLQSSRDLAPQRGSRSFRVLGSRVDAVTLDGAVARAESLIQRRTSGTFIFSTASTVLSARDDADLREAVEEAALVAPDGMPLVWLGKAEGVEVERVYGPDFLLRVLATTGARYRHFFYGGAPGVAAEMAERLKERFPDLQVAGTYSPDRIESGREATAEDVDRINRALPDVVWVGLGHPKQEVWMHRHRQQIGAPVLAGVGAAFDFFSGRQKEAPRWMQRSGLQWLHRLAREPRRLWRRYLIGNARFVWLIARERIERRRVLP